LPEKSLNAILENSIERLKIAIKQLGSILDETPTINKCKDQYDKITSEFSYSKIRVEAKGGVDNWIREYSDRDDGTIPLQLLLDKKDELVVETLKLNLISYTKNRLSQKDCKDRKDDIDFTVYDCNLKRPLDLYSKFINLMSANLVKVNTSEGKVETVIYKPHPHHIAELFYQERKKILPGERKQFLILIEKIKYIQDKIQDKRISKEADVAFVALEKRYSTIDSGFTDEQLRNSGITNANIVFYYINEHIGEINKKGVNWLSIYVILRQREWVEDNVAGFFSTIKDLYGKGIDYRTMNRDLNKNGTDYTKWVGDTRIENRKTIASSFNEYLSEFDKYEELKRHKRLEELIES